MCALIRPTYYRQFIPQFPETIKITMLIAEIMDVKSRHPTVGFLPQLKLIYFYEPNSCDMVPILT